MDRLQSMTSPPPLAALEAGAEPLPGYCLVEPLGKGGFGEVWKCEVSGGLFKAIKFVRDSGTGGFRSAAAQELEALQWIKGIRHPFLLSIERIEVSEGTLILVMELADQNLFNLHQLYVQKNERGIPRPLLLSLLREVAEVLDVMNIQHGLQHLDIKPHNVFLVGAHAKVGDFGLVAGLTTGGAATQGGLTPLYAAPERLVGTWSRSTDQYSLAIVYQQMLTGTTPFRPSSPRQLTQAHLAGPDLSALTTADRVILARALDRDPESRFPTCTALIEALIGGERLPSPSAWLVPGSASESGLFRRPTGTSGVKPAPGPRTSTPGEGPRTTPLEFLPGYHLVECLDQTALRDLWKVRDPEGHERLARWLLQPIDPPLSLIASLEQLRHPSLIPTEIVVSPTRRLVLLEEMPDETLRDQLDACRAEGLSGIPQESLIRWLYPIAEALDWLHSEAGTSHLGLSMDSILLEQGEVRLSEAGLIPLIWMPLKKPAAALNPRYAAPETMTPGGGEPASDQYSLALIYAEAITGIPPRSGQHHRRGQTRFDLDLLHAPERAVLSRALDEDPAARYASCLDFLDALLAASQDSGGSTGFPSVLPLSALLGRTGPSDESLPPWSELVEALLAEATGGESLQQSQDNYRILPGGAWESRYPVHLLPGTLPLKLEGFRHQWGGRKMPSPSADTHIIHLIVTMPRTSIFQWTPPEGGIEVVVKLLPRDLAESSNREAEITLRAVGGNLPEAEKLLAKQGTRLIQSLRTYINPAPEQRTEPRWPFDHPLRVWVAKDSGRWEPRPAQGIDLSRTGLRLTLSAPLEHDRIYLEFPGWAPVANRALLGCVRRRIEGKRGFEYGVSFG